MADIEVVIKIPEKMYGWVYDVNKLFDDNGGISDFIDLIKDGTPLPKGHGKIIDATFALEAKITKDNNGVSERTKGWNEACQAIYENAQTIIDADNEPMQVELEGDGYADGELVYDYGKCPKCGWQYEEGDKDWKEPFCCHCGQRLKWFDNESEE